MPSATAMNVVPLEGTPGFGASVEGIDLNSLQDVEFKALEKALYTHKLLIIRGRLHLDPKKQLELVMRFDPSAKPVHGHGTAKQVMAAHKGKKSLVGANPGVPSEPMVRMIGRATVPAGWHGSTEPIELRSGTHVGFHKEALTEAELAKGDSRFHRWHIDAALYRTHPPKVTSLWTHTLPSGPHVNVRWDNGSGLTMSAKPGLTAFLDATALYRSLSPEDKALVDHSSVEYAPSPYAWIQEAKATSDGFGMVSEGKELAEDDLPDVDESQIKTYPMVWINPLTGEKAFQVHAIVARRLFLRTSASSPTEIISSVPEVRAILSRLQLPFLRPENILIPPQQEGDLCLWWNRGLRHTAIEYPAEGYGPRICHQVHVAGSDDPSCPDMLHG